MANNQIEKWKYVYNNPKSVSRTEPRKIYRGTMQSNSFGLLQKIPNCPKCGSKHSFVVISRVQNRDKRVKEQKEKPIAEQRECTRCGFTSAIDKVKLPLPPTLDQIEYANYLIGQTYLGLRARHMQSNPKSKPTEMIKKAWIKRAKIQAYRYLVQVTNGFPIHELYPHLVDQPPEKDN